MENQLIINENCMNGQLFAPNLIGSKALEFMNENMHKFSSRFVRRPIFRSLYEIENYVVPNDTHPTPDAKYWQLIGEQAVHVQELITLNFSFRKLDVKLRRLEDKIKIEQDLYKKELYQIELEEKRFEQANCQKIAKERMREITNCDILINSIIPNLKYGSEDFEDHIKDREVLRNIIKSGGGTQIDYKSFEHAKSDPIFKDYFDRPVRRILVATPHRNEKDGNVTDFTQLQPPASYSLVLNEPYGYSVPDARNIVLSKCLNEGFEWVFFVDDDVIVPRNALVKLISNNEKVVGGIYYRKYFPIESVPMIEVNGVPSIVDNYGIGDLFPDCLVLSSGCTLIHRSVIESIEPPWYKSFTVEGRAALTEDTYFCSKLRTAGFKPVLDTSIQCIHVDRENSILYGHSNIIKDNKFIDKTIHDYCLKLR
jgi:hypothetical protein